MDSHVCSSSALADAHASSLADAHALIASLTARVAQLELQAAASGAAAEQRAPSLPELDDDVLGITLSFLPDASAAAASSTCRALRCVFSEEGRGDWAARAARACARASGDVQCLPRLRKWLGSWRAVHAALVATGGALSSRFVRVLVDGSASGAFARWAPSDAYDSAPQSPRSARSPRPSSDAEPLAAPVLRLVWRGGWRGWVGAGTPEPPPITLRAVLLPRSALPAFFVAGPFLLTGAQPLGAPRSVPRSLVATRVGRAWASDAAASAALAVALPSDCGADAWGEAVRSAAAAAAFGASGSCWGGVIGGGGGIGGGIGGGDDSSDDDSDADDADDDDVAAVMGAVGEWPGDERLYDAGLAGPWCFALQPLPPLAPPARCGVGAAPPPVPGCALDAARDVEGYYCASYGPHGVEVAHVALVRGDSALVPPAARAAASALRGAPTDVVGSALVGSAFDSPAFPARAASRLVLLGRKVVGDPNVPSGASTFVVYTDAASVVPLPEALALLGVRARSATVVLRARGCLSALPDRFRPEWCEANVIFFPNNRFVIVWDGGVEIAFRRIEGV